jgi:hypothetical protein
MASPRPVGSQLRCRKARNGVVSRRVNERRGCVVVMAITFICAGVCDWNDQMSPACPAAARPSVTLPTRSLSPWRHPVPLTKPGHPSAGLLRIWGNIRPETRSAAPGGPYDRTRALDRAGISERCSGNDRARGGSPGRYRCAAVRANPLKRPTPSAAAPPDPEAATTPQPGHDRAGPQLAGASRPSPAARAGQATRGRP